MNNASLAGWRGGLAAARAADGAVQQADGVERVLSDGPGPFRGVNGHRVLQVRALAGQPGETTEAGHRGDPRPALDKERNIIDFRRGAG